MINFKEFLAEETNQSNNKLQDIDHLMLHQGHEGMMHSANMLDNLHNHFLGKRSDATMTMKYNGHPVIFGKDKKKRFFVAQHQDYPNYSHEDIEKNHGNDPVTASKLKTAFTHLSKIVPDSPGVYQGKMFTKSQVTKSKGKTTIVTPGQSYTVPSDSSHGKKLSHAQMSIAVDAKHNGNSFEPISKAEKNFKDHPDVNHIDTSLPANPSNYTPEEQQAYLNNRKQLEVAYARTKPEIFDALKGHGNKISKHIDQMKKAGKDHSFDTYLESLKGERNHSKLAEHAINNRKHFEDALKMFTLFNNNKNILSGVMQKNEPFMHHVNGEQTEPEGALVHMHKGESKGQTGILRRS